MLAMPAGAAADLLPPQIHTVAGGGSCTVTTPPEPPAVMPLVSPCTGVTATSIPITRPVAVAAVPGGGYLYIDDGNMGNDLIEQVSAAGMVTTVAGNGTATDAPDGTVATASGLNDPVAVTPLPDGGFLVTEAAGSVVRMVSPGPPGTATITTIAGTGTPGYSGLSGPATSTQLNWPTDAELTSGGQVLIADSYNNLVRVLSSADPSATMDTIAGGGSCDDVASVCDGQAAGAVTLHHPVSVSPIQGGPGGFLIAEDEYDANVIRQVSAVSSSGTFSTVAGAPGPPGFGGDGGPATSAQLDQPQQVVSTSGGGFLIADTNNERIRQVSPAGTITTAAGNGIATYAGDGGAATAGSLDGPTAVSPTPGGGMLIADTFNQVIRAVTLAPVTTIKLSPSTPNGGLGWYSSTSVRATISSVGGKSTRCILDPPEAPPAYDAMPSSCPYTGGGASISGDGVHTLYAASVNATGDKELPISISFKIDSTSPVVTCNALMPTFAFGARNALVSATITDPGGSGPRTPTASSPADTSSLGAEQVIVTGYDNAGNAGGQVCSYKVLPGTLKPTPTLSRAFAPHRRFTTIKQLIVTHVPAGASVNLHCQGKGCRFSTKRRLRGVGERGRSRTVDLRSLFAGGQLPAGISLTISVTESGRTGRAFLLTVRARRAPTYRATCLAPGSFQPGKGC